METVIIYGSEYGTTEKYAKRFGELTNMEVKDYSEVNDLAGYQRIIYFGGIYGGYVKGLRETTNRFPTDAEVIVVTVGLSDPEDKTVTEHIVKNIEKQLTPVFHEKAEFVHLRGAIDYKKLSFKHKVMMLALYTKIKIKSERKKTDEDRLIVKTYGDKVDFTDFEALGKITDLIKE